jgi:hypothetical protein
MTEAIEVIRNPCRSIKCDPFGFSMQQIAAPDILKLRDLDNFNFSKAYSSSGKTLA